MTDCDLKEVGLRRIVPLVVIADLEVTFWSIQAEGGQDSGISVDF